jgi:hypothetical protein
VRRMRNRIGGRTIAPLTGILLLASASHLVAEENGADLFAPVASVLTHPRCINCHTVTEYPRQGNDRHRHQFLVMRGIDNQGAVGARCSGCHRDENQSASGVPGAPHWQLSPLSMAWERAPGVIMSNGDLCRRLLDKSHNGGRDLAALEEHLASDRLVHWGFTPGTDAAQHAREAPPLSHGAFVEAFRRWASAGARCPD